MNLLRGAGRRGASGMARESKFHGKILRRPLLGMPRDEILAYAREHKLQWIEDESNADESLTRNFIRRRIGPLLEQKYPKWRQALARAAQHFSRKEAGAEELLREYLKTQGTARAERSQARRDAEAAHRRRRAHAYRARRRDAAASTATRWSLLEKTGRARSSPR